MGLPVVRLGSRPILSLGRVVWSPGGLVKADCWAPRFLFRSWVGVGLRIHICNKFLGDPVTTLWKLWVREMVSLDKDET